MQNSLFVITYLLPTQCNDYTFFYFLVAGLALTDLNVQFTYPSTDKVFVGYVESFPVIFFVQQVCIHYIMIGTILVIF